VRRIYSNASKAFVRDVFDKKAASAPSAMLAAPYFTDADRVLAAAAGGRQVRLIVGLNTATSPYELARLRGVPGIAVRYFTSRFHAKVYIFGEEALLGSANLTDSGMTANREAVICLDGIEDSGAVEELKALFVELWDSAAVLTDEKLAAFTASWKRVHGQAAAADAQIEASVGASQPKNVSVASHKTSRERLFLEELRRLVYEQYRPAFAEVETVLVENGLRRPELAGAGVANETNRFLNWLRLTRIHGEAAWREAPLRGPDERRTLVLSAGESWRDTDDSRVPDDYLDWLVRVQAVFGDPGQLAAADREAITAGLMSLHAFTEQYRFTSGGSVNLPREFWQRNRGDEALVRSSIGHLVHGPGDFVERLHDVLYDPAYKIALLGRFTALELFGTIRPELCPPMNGRMAKTLRFIGFDVPGG
jgi:hypothetical protein